MSDTDNTESRSLKTLFLTGFVLAAAAGGWALGRMGAERDRMKAEAENAVTTGTGTVKEAAPTPAGLPNPVEAKSVETPAPPVVKPAAKEPEEDMTPDEPVAEETVPVGPPKLVLRSVPSADIVLKGPDGVSRTFITDAKGEFRSETLPAGRYEVTVAHTDYKPLEKPATFELKSGETTEAVATPESKPASLILVADAGSTVFLDGAKVGGGGAVMLGSVASRKPLALRVVPGTGAAREESVTLDPRESRLIDLRTPEGIARAKAEAEAEAVASRAVPAEKPSAVEAAGLAAVAAKETASDNKDITGKDGINPPTPENANVPVAPNRTLTPAAPVAPQTVAVKVVSANAGSKLVAFTGPVSGKAPMPEGKAGALRFLDIDAPTIVVKCVRNFGGTSVCEVSEIGPVVPPATAEVTF